MNSPFACALCLDLVSDELPHGWTTATIAEVIELVPNIKPEDSPGKDFGYVDISSINNSRFVITDLKRFKGSDAPSRARRPIRPHDIPWFTCGADNLPADDRNRGQL